MLHTRRVLVTILLLVGLLALTACSAAPQKSDGDPSPTKAMQPVTIVTDFGFNGRHAYYFVALEKGYYRAEGLDVAVERGNGSADAVKRVAAGRATFGFADAGTLVLSRANEQVPAKLIAVIYQKPMHAIYALKDSGIQRPADLEGKTIGGTAGSAVPALFPLYAKTAGVDAAKVKWLAVDSSALTTALLSGEAQAVGLFMVDEPLLRKRASPKELVRFADADAGLDFYGNGIVASDDTIRSNPDLVRAFVRATLRGMSDAFADPAEAGRIMAKYHPEVDPEITRQELELVRAMSGSEPGQIDPVRMQRTIEVISQSFSTKANVTVDDVAAMGSVAEKVR